MTTLRDITQKAFREGGIIGVGTMPDGDEFDEAFSHLQPIIRSLFGNEIGEKFSTYDVGLSQVENPASILQSDDVSSLVYLPDNARLVFNLEGPVTLYLNPSPKDGARLAVIDNLGNLSSNNVVIYGNGRRIESNTFITLTTDLLRREWFYRDDLGGWVKVTDLIPDDESPLPEEFDDLLITLLAFRINPRYGAETSDNTKDLLKRMRSQLRSRYSQEVETSSELGLLLLPSRHIMIKASFNLGN